MFDDDVLKDQPRRVRIAEQHAGSRLDATLAELFSEYSRSRLQQWIKEKRVLLDGASCRPNVRLRGGEMVELHPVMDIEVDAEAEPIPLAILHEDASLLVINKPAGLVVHPAAGNPRGTLLNGLIHHQPGQAELPRGGIVHRLDKDTSGLMVVAKTLQAQHALVKQLQARTVKRQYRAICEGLLTTGGSIDEPIGRHPVNRLKMAVRPNGKEAITHYRIAARFNAHTELQVELETGRTHQIRVHMAYLRHPLVGDPLYGGRVRIPPGASDRLRRMLTDFRRQALHAERLTLLHPDRAESVSWQADPPQDYLELRAALETEAADG